MTTEIIMPKLGMGMENGTVVAWHKAVGDSVVTGETLVEIRSEKIDYEVEAPDSGVLLEIRVPEEGVVPYGTAIGVVGQLEESTSSANIAIDAGEMTTKSTGELDRGMTAGASLPAEGRRDNLPLKSSPLARRMAQSLGVDLHTVRGSGPGGRITKEDVERVAAQVAPPQPERGDAAGEVTDTATLAESLMTGNAVSVPYESSMKSGLQPLSPMRSVIATRMMKSLTDSAQLTLTAKADVTEIVEFQWKYGQQIQEHHGVKLTLLDFVCRAVVLALKNHSGMNSFWRETQLQINSNVNLGVAVSLSEGLVVPVIPSAEELSFMELAKFIKSVAQRTREGRLSGQEAGGSTFTVTNLGAYGVEFFTPILNTPETGILGIGFAQDEPIYVGETLARRTLLPLSLTFDHRVLDGTAAAAFLAEVRQSLGDPVALIL